MERERIDNPLISLVIPVYNAEKYLKQTIESALNQSYENFEINAVDDGSTDQSFSILQGFADPRLRLFRKKNGGVSSARNAGIREAKGEYICFLDTDDVLAPDYMQHMYDIAGDHQADLVICNNMTFNNLLVFQPQEKIQQYSEKWSD